MWGATTSRLTTPSRSRYFSPRSPCGERHARVGDVSFMRIDFNPRSPCGERLVVLAPLLAGIAISTLAPLAGSDRTRGPPTRGRCDFNPRSPCGERRPSRAWRARAPNFNPRSPCGERPYQSGVGFGARAISPLAPPGGSDRGRRVHRRGQRISTLAPPAGSDGVPQRQSSYPCHFNPRSPCGERRSRRPCSTSPVRFQPSLPLRGATR